MSLHTTRFNPASWTWKRWLSEITILVCITLPSAFIFGSLYIKAWSWHKYGISLIVAAVFAIVMRLLPGELAPWVVARVIPSGVPRSAKTVMVIGAVYALTGLIGTYLSLTFSGWILDFNFFRSWQSAYIQLFIGLIVTLLITALVYGVIVYRELLLKTREAQHAREAAIVAELRALRAQVNPHFLFNTLNSISSLIAADPKQADRVVQKLSDIFRYVLIASEKDMVTLSEELAFVRNYLEIERVRFEDKLRVAIQGDSQSMGVRVPSLILQPLVENAIKHGISQDPAGGELSISSQSQNGTVVITISNTGPRRHSMESVSGLGLGLRNVVERLNKTYGKSAALKLTPNTDSGITATIQLPLTGETTRA